ncbi:hypothetical protein [Paraburkholderia diazotrophica]|uniref:Uncharacterized protein n=1 Tax=Paraburkholderia diazotrophica TaxID=667676 RepID=A0A1H7DV51_9BURK|nr:hypothetical protein [Paraburkholderia diazotrophica]SEK05418.1 hypothetical protein SAMN05192539_103513 [Paraburkholderia diazotrophica]
MKMIGLLGLLASAAVQAQVALPLPAAYPTLLGVSCGGVHVASYVTGFDQNGYIHGEVYAWTRCGGSGRGGGYQSQTYQSWHTIVWDLRQNYKVLPYDNVVPDPALRAIDAHGNSILDTCTVTTDGPPACVASAYIYYIPPTMKPISDTVPVTQNVPARPVVPDR